MEILAVGKRLQLLVRTHAVQGAIHECLVVVLDGLVDVCEFKKDCTHHHRQIK